MRKQSIIMFGSPCSGKSTSLTTLLKPEHLKKHPETRLVFLTTESNAQAGLEFGLRHYKIKPEPNQLIIAEVRPKEKAAFTAKLAAFKEFSKGSMKDAFQVGKDTSANRSKYDYLNRVIEGLVEFSGIDYATGETVKLGNIAELKETDILCIDGLTPIIHGIWNMLQGDKLVNDQNDYQVIQKQVKDITQELVNSTKCSIIMLAHEETDANNKVRIALNCGQKLHGSYVGSWTNSIYCFKTLAGDFRWSGKKANVGDIAPRDIPAQDNLIPDFSQYNFFD
jgi:hypothetical protein